MELDSRRELYRLAAGFSSAVREAKARCVLVTSVSGRDGVGRVVPGLQDALSNHPDAPYRFMLWGRLHDLEPEDIRIDEVMVVLGPPMLEGGEFLDLPRSWIDAFDASVVVVGRRHTRRDELEIVAEWLRAAGIPPIGVILSEVSGRRSKKGGTLQSGWDTLRGRTRGGERRGRSTSSFGPDSGGAP